jgi:Tfp pilus assembly protein PilZ
MQFERRRAPRYAFGGVAEVTAPGSRKHLVAVTGELSRLGCFVKTTTPFPIGETVNVRINYDSREIAVPGEVAYVLPTKGMGIAFGAVAATDQAVLEDWLAQTTV